MKRALAFGLILGLAACSKSTATAPPASTATDKPATSAPAPASPAAAGQAPGAVAVGQPEKTEVKPVPATLPDVVARVNGEQITKADLEKEIQGLEQARGPMPKERRDEIYRAILDRIVGFKLLVQESKAQKVAVPDAEVDASVAQIRQRFPNEDEFKKALAQQHVTVDQIKTDARQNMAVQKLIDKALEGKLAIKDDDIQAFYKSNQEHFQEGERVRASHILITVPKDADAATKAKAKLKAQDLLKQARAGKDFAQLAKDNSQDPGSAPSGGDLGFFGRGQMVPQFDAAAFTQKPGVVGDLVETDFGYHIIKVIEKLPSTTVPFDQAKPQIEQYLQQQARDQQTAAFVNSLKAKGKVEILM